MELAAPVRRPLIRPWHRKLALDTVKALLPFKPTLRRAWRRFRPYQTCASNDAGLMQDAIEMAALAEPAGKTVLELGSGWSPVLPLVFRLAGATRITLTDQERLLDHATLCAALDAVGAAWPRIRAALGLPDDRIKLLQVDRSRPLEDLLPALGLRYLVPFDTRAVQSSSVGIVLSRAVLEHVHERDLATLLPEFRRMLVPRGLMVHRIDLSDHWEHIDKSIPRVHFLRHPDWLWRLTQINPQNVQNRLRRADYVRMIERAGFGEVRATGEPHAPSLAALRKMPLAPRFRHLPLEELAVIGTTVTARA